MAECFCQMRPHVRLSMQEKMPLIILCRLIAAMKNLSASNQAAMDHDGRMGSIDKPPTEKPEKPDLHEDEE